MKEILAQNLQLLFDNTPLSGKKTYNGKLYEVWEVSDEVYESMCNMSDEEFERLCSEGMWRSANSCNLGIPHIEYIINGKKILTWGNICGYGKRSYRNLREYLCCGLGASQPKNVCALAVDLAKYNHMTMGELFTKYDR